VTIRSIWVTAGALALGVVACGGDDGPKVQRTSRFLDERRAVQIIRQTMERQGLKPGPAREMELMGRPVRVDVTVEGKEYGVIFLTSEDAEKAGDAVPPQPKGEDVPLRLVSGGKDGDAKFVVLYQQVYAYDDHMGEGHEATTIATEGKLDRDVKDFLIRASSKGFK
jgi:hypothetical protein